MIYTITLTPAVEKRIRGENFDELRFEAKSFSYNIGGCGLKTSLYLKKKNIDSCAALLCGKEYSSFFKEELEKRSIENIIVESANTTPMHFHYIDEEENVISKKETTEILTDEQISLFASVLQEKMKEAEIVSVEYNDVHISKQTFASFYKKISEKADIMICDVHPKYYESISGEKTDVLLVDKKNFLLYMGKDKCALSNAIDIIQKELTPLAKILIYMIDPTDFLIFYNGRVYRSLNLIKLKNKKICREAVFCAIITSLEKDYDFEEMCKECIVMSVGANISDGLFIPSEATLEKLKNTTHVYSI